MENTEIYKNFKINISYVDSNCIDDPLQLFLYNEGARLYGNYKNFTFDNDFSELVDEAEDEDLTVAEYLKRENKYFWPLWGYSHSSLSVSLGREYPYNDQFDSGLFGMIVVDKIPEGYNTIEEFFEGLEAVVSEFNHYLSGEVYGFLIEDASGETIDSCCGYFSLEALMDDARASIDSHIDSLKDRPEAVAILGTLEDVDTELAKIDSAVLADYFLKSASETRKRQALATILETR